jgi:hypothetical protein
MKIMNPYVNEKTLELNITHELMSRYNATAVGFTQNEEYTSGADVELFRPLQQVLVLQFKAPKSGRDNKYCTFLLNSNTNNNQHLSLHMLAQSNLVDVQYCFPIIRTNKFLSNNHGSLLLYCPRIDPRLITQNKNWNIPHSIKIDIDGTFIVRSNDHFSGEFNKDQTDIKKMREKLNMMKPLEEEKMGDFINDTLRKLSSYLLKNNIQGWTEHNFIFFSKNDEGKIKYLQLTTRLKGK